MLYYFYHSSKGMWAAISEPTTELLTSYPEGTIRLPERPSADHQWGEDEGDWVFVEPVSDNPLHRDLSSAEWAFFIDPDVSGFETLINAVIGAMPAGDDRAELRAKAFRAQTYHLDKTLGLVADVRTMGLDGIDAPEDDAIIADWEKTVARETIS